MKHKLTLYQPVTYHIEIPGVLDESWMDWVDEMTVRPADNDGTPPVTVLISTMDQAALQGLLRRLYALGLPLISVEWIADQPE